MKERSGSSMKGLSSFWGRSTSGERGANGTRPMFRSTDNINSPIGWNENMCLGHILDMTSTGSHITICIMRSKPFLIQNEAEWRWNTPTEIDGFSFFLYCPLGDLTNRRRTR